jgi:hypothetical protein
MIWDAITWLANKLVDLFHAGVQELLNWLVALLAAIKMSGLLVMGGVLSVAASLMPSVDLAPLTETLETINTYFPLGETITLALGLFVLWGVVFFYRLIKSWVPTVSS